MGNKNLPVFATEAGERHCCKALEWAGKDIGLFLAVHVGAHMLVVALEHASRQTEVASLAAGGLGGACQRQSYVRSLEDEVVEEDVMQRRKLG